MARLKYDGVLEVAHFNQDGQLDWVRVYQRMGAVFSDRILLRRTEFIEQLKAGKRYVVGERIHNLGGTFNVSQPVHLLTLNGSQVIAVGNSQATTDNLTGVPII